MVIAEFVESRSEFIVWDVLSDLAHDDADGILLCKVKLEERFGTFYHSF